MVKDFGHDTRDGQIVDMMQEMHTCCRIVTMILSCWRQGTCFYEMVIYYIRLVYITAIMGQ